MVESRGWADSGSVWFPRSGSGSGSSSNSGWLVQLDLVRREHRRRLNQVPVAVGSPRHRHTVMQGERTLRTVAVNGDAPLLRRQTLERLQPRTAARF